MKKFLISIMSTVLSACILMSATSFANQISPENDFQQILDSFSDDEIGGAYIENNILHIKPIEQTDIEQISTYSNSYSVVFDSIAKYSISELKDAQDRALDLFESLDIDYVAIDDVNNGLAVGICDLTEEKEELFNNYIGIDNITFENVGNIIDNFDEGEKDASKPSPMAATEIVSGVSVSDIDKSDPDDSSKKLAATIGASVSGSGTKYFVSTAHGVDVGDRFTYNINNPIGTVNKKVMSGSEGIDISLIKLNESNAKLSSKTINNKMILTSGAPITGNTVYIINGNNPVEAKIKFSSCTKVWHDSGNDDVQTYKNIIMMEPSGTRMPEGGDSGSAVVTELSNGMYNICGIYKGRSEEAGTGGKAINSQYKYMFATRWDVVSDYFNVDIY